MVIVYPADKQVFADAADLIIHHVKRQTGMQPEEKAKIKRLLKKTIPDMFRLDSGLNLSDDEDEEPGEISYSVDASRLRTSIQLTQLNNFHRSFPNLVRYDLTV